VATLNAAIDSGAKKKRLGVIMGPPVQTSSQQERTGFKGETMSLKELRDRSIREKADRFTTGGGSPKETRFTTPTGGRVRSLVTIKTVRKPTGGTEAALTAFVPTVVAPFVPSTPTGGGYSGGGGSYPGYDSAPTEETIATEQIDESLLENIDEDGNIIGDGGATAGAIAAAAPIVAMIIKILSKNKVSTGAEDQNLTDDITKATEEAGEEAMADIDKEAEGIPTPTGDKILEGTKSKPTPAGGKFPIMPALLVGGGLLAFTLLKKRK
jgi:hypothetical protein